MRFYQSMLLTLIYSLCLSFGFSIRAADDDDFDISNIDSAPAPKQPEPASEDKKEPEANPESDFGNNNDDNDDEPRSSSSESGSSSRNKDEGVEIPRFKEKAAKPLSVQEKQEICKKYEGKHVGFYDKVFRIQNCKRIPIAENDVYGITRSGVKVVDVPSRAILALPLENKSSEKKAQAPSCINLKGKYLALFDEIYFVDEVSKKCVRRLFPDYASYEQHRGSAHSGMQKLITLKEDDTRLIPKGPDMPSVLGRITRDLFPNQKEPDIIPINQACKPYLNQVVSYLDRLFKITPIPSKIKGLVTCVREEIDGEQYTKNMRNFKIKEIPSEVALSIPVKELQKKEEIVKHDIDEL